MNLSQICRRFLETIQSNKIDIYNEAGLQHDLGCFIRKEISRKNKSDWKIQFERNVLFFGIKQTLIKEKIDLVVFNQELISKKAVELKVPLSGQVPIQMFESVKDIKFLEQLLEQGFEQGIFILITNNNNFWEGKKRDTIYRKYREEKKLYDAIECTTGKDKGKTITLTSSYQIRWNHLSSVFRYFMIELP